MGRPFALVEETDDRSPDPPPEKPAQDHSFAIDALLLSLKALGQRTLIALSNLFSLITALTMFWAALTILHEPTVPQLIGLGMYAVFILALNIIVRKA